MESPVFHRGSRAVNKKDVREFMMKLCQQYDHKSRKAYLEKFALTYDVDKTVVFILADLLCHSEDINGLTGVFGSFEYESRRTDMLAHVGRGAAAERKAAPPCRECARRRLRRRCITPPHLTGE